MSAIGAIAGTVGTIAAQAGANIGTQAVNNRFAYKWTRKLGDIEFGRNLDMWNRVNEYNLPINQMQRLDEAGLNPNMMYGTGQGANTTKEMPKYNTVHFGSDMQPLNVMGILSGYQDIKVKQAQIDNINAQTEIRRLENELKTGTIPELIKQAAFKTRDTYAKAELNMLAKQVEYQFQGMQGAYLSDEFGNPQGLYSGTSKKLSELSMTQEASRRTSAEADLKEVEVQLYKILKGIGAGATAINAVTGLLRGAGALKAAKGIPKAIGRFVKR